VEQLSDVAHADDYDAMRCHFEKAMRRRIRLRGYPDGDLNRVAQAFAKRKEVLNGGKRDGEEIYY
jgi:hypothetical protein